MRTKKIAGLYLRHKQIPRHGKYVCNYNYEVLTQWNLACVLFIQSNMPSWSYNQQNKACYKQWNTTKQWLL